MLKTSFSLAAQDPLMHFPCGKLLRESGIYWLFLISFVFAFNLLAAHPECSLSVQAKEKAAKGQAEQISAAAQVMNKEIEIKIQVDDAQFTLLKAWLSEHAEFKGALHHTEWYLDNPQDTFFFTSQEGYKDALKYLRVRHTERGDSVAYKLWHRDPETGKTTHCDEYETNVENGQVMLALFAQLGFSEQTKIAKRREAYETPEFEIAIDHIEGLGYFVEIEVLHPKENVKESLADIYDFLKRIGITRFCKIERGYVSMFWNPEYDFGDLVELK
ncbi:MAG: class IV adenylate cyclase [Candidatus Babeliales bacterium]